MGIIRYDFNGVELKFLADMNISPKTVQFLRNVGYDIYRVNELLGAGSIEDITIFEYAANNEFTIITSDYDFGEILALTRNRFPSVIILRNSDRRIPNVNKILENDLANFDIELKEGSIIVIEDFRIRIRRLPLS